MTQNKWRDKMMHCKGMKKPVINIYIASDKKLPRVWFVDTVDTRYLDPPWDR